jgi:hypothetical protein
MSRHAVPRARLRRSRLIVIASVAVWAATSALVTIGSPGQASADIRPVVGATTVTGSGEFSNLRVSVSSTTSLVNQTIKVSWAGAAPSVITGGGTFLTNYLQIMQCWAEPGRTPEREQCQFGGFVDVPQGAGNVASRQVTQFAVDPAETEYVKAPGSNDLAFVDFRGVDGLVTTGKRSQFFDGATTNEIPVGRTRPDGTGEQFFEVQTGLEAPGLGCGQVINGRRVPLSRTAPRSRGPSTPLARPR